MPELMTIGEVADRARVATSTIRYYERHGLLSADTRQSGQRRYRVETLRRLVFIRMMQDIGLTLDEVHGILHAATMAEWKSIAGQRLEALDDQIAQLQFARELLTGGLVATLADLLTEGPAPSRPVGVGTWLAPDFPARSHDLCLHRLGPLARDLGCRLGSLAGDLGCRLFAILLGPAAKETHGAIVDRLVADLSSLTRRWTNHPAARARRRG